MNGADNSRPFLEKSVSVGDVILDQFLRPDKLGNGGWVLKNTTSHEDSLCKVSPHENSTEKTMSSLSVTVRVPQIV